MHERRTGKMWMHPSRDVATLNNKGEPLSGEEFLNFVSSILAGNGGTALNRPEHTIKHVGNDKTAVVTIDNFLSETEPGGLIFLREALRDHAFQSLTNRADNDNVSSLPGLIINLEESLAGEYASRISARLNPVVKRAYGHSLSIGEVMPQMLCNGSKAGDNGKAIELGESLTAPHYDPRPDDNVLVGLAMVHYIQHSDIWPPREAREKGINAGGTGLYRSKHAGLEHITRENCEGIRSKLEKEEGGIYKTLIGRQCFSTSNSTIMDHTPPKSFDNKYLTDGNDEWELIDTLEWKGGRIVMYPFTQLHGAYIGELAPHLTCDPATGRLAISSFWDLR
jgi:hypothetical protein